MWYISMKIALMKIIKHFEVVVNRGEQCFIFIDAQCVITADRAIITLTCVRLFSVSDELITCVELH